MAPLSPTPTYAEVIEKYRLQHQHHVDMEQISPFAIPKDIFSYVILIVCLMMTRFSLATFRVLTFSAIVSFSLLTLQKSRTLGLGYGILVGISSSWCVASSINLLFLHQPARNFKRKIASSQPVDPVNFNESSNPDGTQWQGIPSSTYAKFCWIIDLLGSLRLLHWSDGRPKDRTSNNVRQIGPGVTPSLQHTLGKLLLIYLSVDCLKEVIANDPYFWGYTASKPSKHIQSILQYASFIQVYRMAIAFAVLYVAIELISTTSVLLFVHILGPRFSGSWGYGWAHRSQLGHLDSVCRRGLQGFWGEWWHQMFRITVVAPSHVLVDALQIPPKGYLARFLDLVISFLISGAIHASGSYTSLGDTKPLNAFLFFALQPAGIATQMAGSYCFNKVGLRANVHPNLRKATNVAFTIIWFLRTSPLLADDIARGGLFLSEPFPISLLQTLGIGSAARSHQLWSDYGVHVYRGSRWWQIGLAM